MTVFFHFVTKIISPPVAKVQPPNFLNLELCLFMGGRLGMVWKLGKL